IEIGNLIRHGTTPPLEQLLRDIARDQLLIANANSEVGVGGDVGRSVCCLTPTDDGLFLDKQALAVSYGEHADFIVSTARRTPESEETDQATMVLRRADLTLEPTTEWNTLGLRGTCSRSFHIQGKVDPELIFPVPFSEIASQGGIQGRQILTSAVWVGLAEAGAAKAHAYVRAAARKVVGSEPPSALRLAEISVELQQARDTLAATALRFELSQGTEEMVSAGFVTALRSLKVGASEMANRVLTASLGICGMAGYASESPMSLGRLIRDAHGGAIMVNNDRYLHDNAKLLLARKNL
ncbi:MAG: acyl-CoA dehydrogenase family protein, partial [Nocardioidaceae bacterium]